MDIQKLLALLADGEFHSGEQLGAQAGLTRAAVWKQIRKLERWGLQVESSVGRGYRLSQPIELLNVKQLRELVASRPEFELEEIEIFTEASSTSRYLLENMPGQSGLLRLCMAEWQSAGRGRHGRHWNSPLGTGICLSAAWTYDGTPRAFSTLSLAAGSAIADAILDHSGVEVQLKWPNDVVWRNQKLGGILVESRIESHGKCNVVVGVGINYSMPDDLLARVCDWGATDLRSAVNGALPKRNVIAGHVAGSLGTLLASFARGQTEPWIERWRSLDYLRGKAIRVGTEETALEGRADGIDDDGALLVLSESGIRERVLAGDASVRVQ